MKKITIVLLMLSLLVGCGKSDKRYLSDEYDSLGQSIKDYLDIELYPTYQGKNAEIKVLSSCSVRDYLNIDYYFYDFRIAPIYLDDSLKIDSIEITSSIEESDRLLAEINSSLQTFSSDLQEVGITHLSFYIRNADLLGNKIVSEEKAYEIASNLEMHFNYNGKKEIINLELEIEPYLDDEIERNSCLNSYFLGKEEIIFETK